MKIGHWQVDDAAKRLIGPEGEIELEPRVMDLLVLLARQPGVVISKSQILEALWGDVYVNEDALTRSVFKLRKALGDDAREPSYVETVSKRGYRLIAEVSGTPEDVETRSRQKPGLMLTVGIALLAVFGVGAIWIFKSQDTEQTTIEVGGDKRLMRADGFYSQYTRTDNEAALQLYERVLEDSPDDAAAMAGLANALTQRQVRYIGPGSGGEGRGSLSEALESGWLETPEAISALTRATALAARATETDPSHARAWRALGLALSAKQDFDAAERAYERALVIRPDDWGTMINLSELTKLMGKPERSTPYLEQAWYAMEQNFSDEPIAIRPWHSEVGLSVARAKADDGMYQEAELWYRRVLALDPLNAAAVRELSGLLSRFGDPAAAKDLCDALVRSGDERC
ncbi:MAG: winged helix-turn-helix domain-containing protein [Pseudomonadota bacterium]